MTGATPSVRGLRPQSASDLLAASASQLLCSLWEVGSGNTHKFRVYQIGKLERIRRQTVLTEAVLHLLRSTSYVLRRKGR